MGGDSRIGKCCCSSDNGITIIGYTTRSSTGYIYVLKCDLSAFTWERVEAQSGVSFTYPWIWRDAAISSRLHLRYIYGSAGYWKYGNTGSWTRKDCVTGKNGATGFNPSLASGLSLTGYIELQRNINRYVPASDTYNTENINFIPADTKMQFDSSNYEHCIVAGVRAIARYTGSTTWAVSSDLDAGYNLRNFAIYNDNDYCLNNNASETRVSIWDGSSWTHATVESNSSTWGDITIDANGYVHLVYTKGYNLYYATNLSGSYVVTQIATYSSSPSTQMKILIYNGYPVVVYCNFETSYVIHVMSNPAGTWNDLVCNEYDGLNRITSVYLDACI